MDIVYGVIGLALIQCFIFSVFVARARVGSKVSAPAMSGNETFERYVRVHYNTLELLVLWVPGMLLFAHYISSLAAAIIGFIFILGRALYFRAYVTDPPSRGPGFGLSVLPTLILLVGGTGGAAWRALVG